MWIINNGRSGKAVLEYEFQFDTSPYSFKSTTDSLLERQFVFK